MTRREHEGNSAIAQWVQGALFWHPQLHIMIELNIFCTVIGIIKKILHYKMQGELTYYKHRPRYRQDSFLYLINKKICVLITLGILHCKKWNMHIHVQLFSVLLNNSLLLSRCLNFMISNDWRQGTVICQWQSLFSSAHGCIAICSPGNPCLAASLPCKEEGIDPTGICRFSVYQLVRI